MAIRTLPQPSDRGLPAIVRGVGEASVCHSRAIGRGIQHSNLPTDTPQVEEGLGFAERAYKSVSQTSPSRGTH